MAFGISRSEAFGAAYRRLILEDIAGARAGLLDAQLSPEEGVHGARRRLKRIRSIIRLVRPSLGRQYDAYRDDIRSVAQSLAVFRDADVLKAMVTDLRAISGPDQQALIDRAFGSLNPSQPNRRRGTLIPVLLALEELELDAEDLPVQKHGKGLYRRAVDRAYRRGRRSMQRARRSRAAADFHRWRKDAKDLWHLLELARRCIPRSMRRHAARIDTLAEILGLDHDYWITGEHIAKISGDASNQAATRDLVAARRKRLQKDALKRGKRLYRRKPGAFRALIRLR